MFQVYNFGFKIGGKSKNPPDGTEYATAAGGTIPKKQEFYECGD